VTTSSDQPRPGRAFHPPFTHFPVAAYVFAAAFDVISAAGGPRRTWALQLWHAGTIVLIAGILLCLLTMLTGVVDLLRLPAYDAGAARTIGRHVVAMVGVFIVGSGEIAWRLAEYHSRASTPAAIMIISLAVAAGACVGAAHGGSLVFRYGLGVRATAPAPVPVSADAALTPGETRRRSRHGRLRILP
jgi:uncharacterized membrane protein